MGCEAPICVDANVRPAHVGTDRETVVLLHGSASSSGLWRHAKAALQARYRCIAPDLIGYGSSAAWSQQAAFSLEAELRAIEQSLQCCADTLHLVGYSYGGVLALHLALADPGRVQSLTLIEPVFFAALKYAGDWSSYFEFCRVRDEFVAAHQQRRHALYRDRPQTRLASRARSCRPPSACSHGRPPIIPSKHRCPSPHALPGRCAARAHAGERAHRCGRREPPVAADPRLAAHERDSLKPARR